MQAVQGSGFQCRHSKSSDRVAVRAGMRGSKPPLSWTPERFTAALSGPAYSFGGAPSQTPAFQSASPCGPFA
jgi:hypothetical protein